MKKSSYIWIVALLVIIIGVIIYFYVFNNNTTDNSINNNEVSGERTSTNINNDNNRNLWRTKNSAGRLTNIRITCGILNGFIINPGDTFSFNNIVGKPTSERGYQEAKIIINHKAEMGLGGRKLSGK